MKTWLKYEELLGMVTTMLDRKEADQTPPSFARCFDFMVALCSVAGPEETLSEANGDFSSVGHCVIYERWADALGLAEMEGSTCECDGWILTTLQNDGGYQLEKIGDHRRIMSFSHEEPEWEPRTLELLRRSYWRVLNLSLLLTA